MDNLGEVFKKAREEKGLTVKDVAVQTNIGSKFIKAIENNDFSVFPGEAYTVGFIRNYAEFLKVDPEKVIKLFYTNQIAESETPIEELVAPTKPQLNPIPIILFIVLIIGIIAGVYFFLRGKTNKPDNKNNQNITAENTDNKNNAQKENQNENVKFDTLPIYSTKAIGDKVYLQIGNKKLSIEFKKISEKSVDIMFSSIGDNDFLVNMRKEYKIEANKELRFDAERNKTYDFSIGIEKIPNTAQVKVFIKKIDTAYESQRYYDYFPYTKPDQATLTQLQQNNPNQKNNENTNENNKENNTNNQQTNTQQSNVDVKLNITLTNSMQRDTAIYIWVKRDDSSEIQTLRLNRNQTKNLVANSKITLDTTNVFGLKIKVNGRDIQTKRLANAGAIAKLRFWVDKSQSGKTEIKWEINR